MAAKDIISSGKDLLALARDLFLFLLGTLLLCFPSCLNDRLTKAGFQEGDIMGLKWKSSLVKSDQALKEMTLTDSLLRMQNDSLSRLLTQLYPHIASDSIKKEIASLQISTTKLRQAAALAQSSAQNTIATNASVVVKAQKSVNEGEQWGVVFGADADLPGAKYERDIIARKKDIPGVSIYYRQGFYRSVAVTASRDYAETILETAKTRRADAYIVPMSIWCPKAVKNGDYLMCSTGN